MNTPMRRIYAQVSEICPPLVGMDLTPEEVERFDARIRRGPGCWEWSGEVNNHGYGRFAVWRGEVRTRLLAHRLAYRLETGADLAGRVLRHACDNPLCVRLAHLMPGTQTDNMRDAMERGRMNLSGLFDQQREQKARVLERLAAGVKTCCVCRTGKSLDDFHRNRSTADGRQSICKECRYLGSDRGRRTAA